MATTIITKNGSGAPLAGDLQVAELALDLTNKKLYSKEGTTVFEVGATGGGASGTFTDLTATNSFTSVGIDDNATSTAITIDSSENVGIGTTSPDANLEIRKDNASGLGAVLSLTNSNSSGLTGNSVAIGLSAYAHTTVDSTSYRGAIIRGETTAAGNGHSIIFETSDTSAVPAERVRIDHDGNVGIGETSPSYLLHASKAGLARVGVEATDASGADVVFLSNGTLGGVVGDRGDGTFDIDYRGGNALTFSSTGTERMRINSSGQVAIGTTSPNSYANYRVLTLRGTNGAEIDFENSSGTVIGAIYNNATDLVIASDFSNTVANSNIVFTCDSAERMRIDSSGNVGLGVTPSAWGSGEKAFQILGTTYGGGVFASGNNVGTIVGANAYWDGSGYKRINAVPVSLIQFSGGATYFYRGGTGAANSAVTLNSSMVIDSSGNLLVGTTTDAGRRLHVVHSTLNNYASSFVHTNSSSPFGLLIDYSSATPNNTGNQFITCTDSTNTKFDVASNGDVRSRTNSYAGFSDENLKQNIVDATPKLQDLMDVRVRNYEFKDDAGNKQLGVIAQELEAVFPSLITEDNEGIKSVKYSVFVPMLIKGMQEQQEMIEELKAEVAALKGA